MPDLYTITTNDILFRRFPIEPLSDSFFKVVNGRKIPTSAAFKTKRGENGLSVDVAALTTPEKSVLDKEKFGLCSFPASIPLAQHFECVHDPEPDNPAHALILGDTKKLAKKISSHSQLEVLIAPEVL